MDARPALLRILLAAGLLAMPPMANAQATQRCIGADGSTVYTDRPCADLGAIKRLPPPPPAGSTLSAFRTSCPRRLSDLVHEVSAAIDSRDVNRLASVYLWSGVSTASANSVLDRLEAIVERPLVDIVPIRPDPLPAATDTPDETNGARSITDEPPPTHYTPRPTGLRIVQTLRNSATPSNTTFGLRRSYNCFWITL